MDYIEDVSSLANTEEDAETNEYKERLYAAIEHLTPEEQVIISHKWGLLDHRIRTAAEVAEDFQSTIEEINILEKIILNKLRSLIDRTEINLDKGVDHLKFNIILRSVGSGTDKLKTITLLKQLKVSNPEDLSSLPKLLMTDIHFSTAELIKEQLASFNAKVAIISKV